MSKHLLNKYMIKDLITGSFKPQIIVSAPSLNHGIVLRDLKQILQQQNELSIYSQDLQLFYTGTIDQVTAQDYPLESIEHIANLSDLKIQAHKDFLKEQNLITGENEIKTSKNS